MDDDSSISGDFFIAGRHADERMFFQPAARPSPWVPASAGTTVFNDVLTSNCTLNVDTP